ncbi:MULTISPECIES: hypothetical protein [unclassified Acinetobacter]|uniref:hypothetical protein n=1 Tax=unclassified Acinetobacter TaxID=196816 RepID=UPI00235ECB84|nr:MULTISPECIES: hypothetical protein [unclassified Acinetobacter]
MNTIQVFDELQQKYAQYLENQHYPKLERLNNWGKNRFFFHQYFHLIEDQHQTEQIVIEFHQRQYCLQTGKAPDFMDQEKYMAWLIQELWH